MSDDITHDQQNSPPTSTPAPTDARAIPSALRALGSRLKPFLSREISQFTLFGLLTFVMSFLALLQDRKPYIPEVRLTDTSYKTHPHCNDGARGPAVWALLRYEFTNSSEITSLKGIRQDNRNNPVMAKSSERKQFGATAVLLAPKTIDQIPANASAAELDNLFIESRTANSAFINFETPAVGDFDLPISGTINTGVPAAVTLGFKSDAVQGGKHIRRFILYFEFVLAGGDEEKIIPVKTTLVAPSEEEWACVSPNP